MENKYYLNLTNGIEFLTNNNLDYKFIRIQSTHCERHLWNNILLDLDYNFLLDLALGYNVIVFDTSQHKKESRAMYQGLKFIEYVLNRYWLNKEPEIKVKDMICNNYFREEYKSIDDKVFRKLKYLKKFINTESINLKSICKNTIHDSDYEYYKNILIKYYK